jgi:NAD+ synthetase
MPRIALAQIKPAKGDYAANLDRIGGVLQQVAAAAPRIDLVVFPETVTSGYFVEGGVRQVAVTAGTLARDLAARHKAAGGVPLDVAVGFYEVYQSRLFNSCLYATLDGGAARVRHVHRKVFLPTYGLFDEERFVDKGHDIRAFDTGFGWRAAVLICEDVWHSLSGIIAAVDGARLFIVPSASPARGTAQDEEGLTLPASMVRWERLVRGVAEEHGVYVALANLVGFEGGKGFSGGSAVIDPMGHIAIRGPLFEESLLTADLDPDTVTHARADAPMLGDLESELPHLVRSLEHAGQGSATQEAPREGRDYDSATEPSAPGRVLQGSRLPAPAIPVVGLGHEPEDPLQLDCELARRWLVAFLKDEVVRRRGFAKALVGVSGGVDSALTAHLAVQALGPDHVIAVRMPYRTSSPESFAHAQLVIDQLGVETVTVDISDAVDGYCKQVGEMDPTRRGNVMARTRMIVLFDLSAKHRALPLGTGNKSERLLGYFTWHADDTPPVNPLGDLFKTQVWALARHVGVPEEILAKPATPDLVPGQRTEADYGFSYVQADPILYLLVRGYSAEEIVARGYEPQVVAAVRRRLESTHWKRKLPTVAVMSQTAIGEYYLRPVDY